MPERFIFTHLRIYWSFSLDWYCKDQSYEGNSCYMQQVSSLLQCYPKWKGNLCLPLGCHGIWWPWNRHRLIFVLYFFVVWIFAEWNNYLVFTEISLISTLWYICKLLLVVWFLQLDGDRPDRAVCKLLRYLTTLIRAYTSRGRTHLPDGPHGQREPGAHWWGRDGRLDSVETTR